MKYFITHKAKGQQSEKEPLGIKEVNKILKRHSLEEKKGTSFKKQLRKDKRIEFQFYILTAEK